MNESSESDFTSLIYVRPAFPVVVSGPSGVGKTSIVQAALEQRPEWRASISTTTRPPRQGEVSGQAYDFVSPDEFEGLKASGAFLETAQVHGFLYGTPRSRLEEFLKQGRVVVLNLDTQGGTSLRNAFHNGVSIFILPPSIEVLRERLQHRNTDPPEVVERRLENARLELRQVSQYSYVIVNENLQQAVRQLIGIIETEQSRVERRLKK